MNAVVTDTRISLAKGLLLVRGRRWWNHRTFIGGGRESKIIMETSILKLDVLENLGEVLKLLRLLIVPTLQRRIKFSLLNFPSFPPAAPAVWKVEVHCFSVTEGKEQREKTRSLSHWKQHNLTDNVTHNVTESQEGAATRLDLLSNAAFTEGKVGHNFCNGKLLFFSHFSTDVRALEWMYWSQLKQNRRHNATHMHTPSATKCRKANEFHISYCISSNAAA